MAQTTHILLKAVQARQRIHKNTFFFRNFGEELATSFCVDDMKILWTICLMRVVVKAGSCYVGGDDKVRTRFKGWRQGGPQATLLTVLYNAGPLLGS